LNFSKYHGLGNDFVLIDSRKKNISKIDLKKLAVKLCDRHFGIGADGILIVRPSKKANYRMQIFNPDGSEPEMCGNGIRCFAKYVYETDKLKKKTISVETLGGIMKPDVILGKDGSVAEIRVDMGIAKDQGEVSLHGYSFKKISMGNPHAITFIEDLSKVKLAEIGPKIENDIHFPNRTNVEFVKVIKDNEIQIMVWERGAGETLACGTGACASAVASILDKKVKGNAIKVHLPGGELVVQVEKDLRVYLQGSAEFVFKGNIQLA
jgi:diaminopimelate epimerase